MRTVLIADDNPASRELLREVLASRGFSLIEAVDGREALGKIQTDSPDLALIDIQMPYLDGFALLTAVRALDPPRKIRMLALTAFAMESDRIRILEAGFDGYVSKPISIANLRRQIDRLLSEDKANGAQA